MKKHYFYKVTNKVNGKYYLGVHTSEDPWNDYYFGSGPAIKAAVKKYGKENFKKEVLEILPTLEEAYKYEAEHVTLKEVQDPQCYNMQIGGLGGTTGAIFMQKENEITRILPEQEQQYLEEGWQRYKKVHSPETLRKMRESHLGRKLTEEQRKAAKERSSKYIWIKKNEIGTRIFPEELDKYLADGWVRGRTSAGNQKIRETLKKFNRDNPREFRVYVYSPETDQHAVIPEECLEKYLQKGWVRGNGLKGKKTLSKQTIAKRSASLKKTLKEKGSRTGINDGIHNKFVYNTELEGYLKQGWKLGKKLK